MTIDRSKADIRKSWQFKPFKVPKSGLRLADVDIAPDHELIVVERKGQKRAFSMRELAYHHIAQGELAGEPYVVSF